MPSTPPEGRRRWAVVEHAAHEGPGTLAAVLAGAGLEGQVVAVHRGEPLPALSGLGGLVSMGGPMGVHDDDRFPWLAEERAWLSAAVAAGLPVLGVCLGAQQLAAALGAAVTTGESEVGVGRVELTGAGTVDPVLGPEGPTLDVLHWHADTFAVPPGGVWLARSDRCRHQAFRVGRLAYGLQFHLEVDRPLLETWRPELPAGVSVAEADRAAVEAAGRRVFGRFVALARAS